MSRARVVTPDYDVVVVGGGGAGLTAAATARSAGASVLVLEGSRALGGSTAVASGSFLAAGTDVQRAAGIVDDGPDALFRFWMNACQWIADPAIVRRYCDEAPAALAWLAGHGVAYTPELLRATPLADVARVHRPEGAGQAIVDALARTCRERDVDIALANKVDRLVVHDDAVTGVESGGEVVGAGVVVLTTGGFARNAALLATHFPDTSIAGQDLWSPAPDTCQGEGLLMALNAGAATDGANRGEMVLSNGLVSDFEPYRPGWPIFVNTRGRRFVSETAPNAAMLRIFREQAGPVWAVFDEAARVGGAAGVDDLYAAGSWGPDVIARGVTDGRVHRAGTVAGLAELIDVPVATLVATVEDYNASAASGVDGRFLKDEDDLRPLLTPPYHAVAIKPMIVPVTGYGVRIDPDAHVLDDTGRPIPGLLAAGEVTGSVFGSQYVSHGQAIGTAITFGRIAGRVAAAVATPVAGIT